MALLPLPALTDDQIKTIEDLAAASYSPEKIALYLDLDKKQFLESWYDKLSEARTAYDKGQLEAEFLINQKQLELAKAGNITAAQIALKEIEKVKTDNILNQVLFGA
ncbi:MAG: hypothetical protein BM557_01275 [Flavobacterium sp. MedPE-SWcel]|uniref:hypothetical protein n=1 Tax=uncultured Flavobacterium sp. TaxID=165435 RepID=UPI000911943A|nr:hypothetical protein [uncultured Flavobacterium sp.]OIQ22038.1 MAG: hypothetical protein BM557_01275 [Flavobacterium sp. MedPE-SWcel]